MSGSSIEDAGNVEGSGTVGHAHKKLVPSIVRWVVLIPVSIVVFGACFGIPPPGAVVVLVSGLVATVTFAVVDRPAFAWGSAIAALMLSVWLVPAWSCFLIAALPIWALGYVFSPDRNSRKERVIFACVLSTAIVAVAEGREGGGHAEAARDAVAELRSQAVDAVVLGCTEIPLLLGADGAKPDLINPAALLAETAVRFAIEGVT